MINPEFKEKVDKSKIMNVFEKMQSLAVEIPFETVS